MSKQRSFSMLLAGAALALVVALPAAAQLPEGFKARDIGEPGAAGSTTVENGKWTVKGAGADLWGADNDHFQFASKEVTGDGNVTARLLGTSGGHLEDGWEKVGVMIRENDTQGSPHAMTHTTNRGKGLYFARRPEADSDTAEENGFAPRFFPVWLRTQRVGSEFSGFYSTDGVLWNFMSTQTVTMGNTANFGIFEMSHEDGVISTSEWDNVSVNPGQTQVAGLQGCSSANGVLLTWKPLAGAQSYNVYRGPAGANVEGLQRDQLAKINTDSVAQASYSDIGDSLAPGARHVYAVAAVTGGTEGPLTVIIAGKTGPIPAPTGFTFSVIGDNPEGECALGSVGVYQDANGVITMRGGGHDIWDDGDDFTFLHQKVSGNFRITVTMLTNPSGGQDWAKSGPMIRENLDRGSRHGMFTLLGMEGAVASWREEVGGASSSTDSVDGERALTWNEVRDQFATGKPILMRLTRQGDTITPEYSLDGTTFKSGLGPITIPGLANEVEVGIAMTSHHAPPTAEVGRIGESRFRDIQIEKL